MRNCLANTLWIISSALVLGASACSSAPKSPPPADTSPELARTALSDSGVEITYVLERTQRHLTAEASGGKVFGKYLRDRILMSEGSLDEKRYTDFLTRALQFVQTPHRATAAVEPCRAPFTVNVRLEKETKTSTGCRSEDEGALSRLVKDAEFLLYSKK